jgi:hypothetical protein
MGDSIRLAIVVVVVVLGAAAACSRSEQQLAPIDAAAPPPPVRDTGAPPVRDAAADLGVDAGPDGPPGHKRAASHAAAGEASGGGAAGLQVSGGLDKADVSKVLHAKAGAMRACYQRERSKTPGLRGRVTFRVTVDKRGLVKMAEAEKSTLGGGDAEMCMLQTVRDMRFPPVPSGGESTVSFQMGFGGK